MLSGILIGLNSVVPLDAREIYNFFNGTVTTVVTRFRTNLKTSETWCLLIYILKGVLYG